MGEEIRLPKPRADGPLALEAVLAKRRSIRSFRDVKLELAHVSQLLWAAQGITGDDGLRAAPSAGARYPIELYAVLPEGVFRYHPETHSMTQAIDRDIRRELCVAAQQQESIVEAPLTVAFAVVKTRTQSRYGKSRGERYVHLDVGHSAENVLLQAVSLGLGAVPIGAFDDAKVHEVLGLPADQEALYMIPVGYGT
jgi:SagB-type dehydrogenase family enzyme